MHVLSIADNLVKYWINRGRWRRMLSRKASDGNGFLIDSVYRHIYVWGLKIIIDVGWMCIPIERYIGNTVKVNRRQCQ